MLSISTLAWATRDNLMNYVQYSIEKENVMALSMRNLTVKLCNNCSPITLKVDPQVSFYENRSDIDHKTAMELYVKRDYQKITIFINHEKNIVDGIFFGNPNNTSNIKD